MNKKKKIGLVIGSTIGALSTIGISVSLPIALSLKNNNSSGNNIIDKPNNDINGDSNGNNSGNNGSENTPNIPGNDNSGNKPDNGTTGGGSESGGNNENTPNTPGNDNGNTGNNPDNGNNGNTDNNPGNGETPPEPPVLPPEKVSLNSETINQIKTNINNIDGSSNETIGNYFIGNILKPQYISPACKNFGLPENSLKNLFIQNVKVASPTVFTTDYYKINLILQLNDNFVFEETNNDPNIQISSDKKMLNLNNLETGKFYTYVPFSRLGLNLFPVLVEDNGSWWTQYQTNNTTIGTPNDVAKLIFTDEFIQENQTLFNTRTNTITNPLIGLATNNSELNTINQYQTYKQLNLDDNSLIANKNKCDLFYFNDNVTYSNENINWPFTTNNKVKATSSINQNNGNPFILTTTFPNCPKPTQLDFNDSLYTKIVNYIGLINNKMNLQKYFDHNGYIFTQYINPILTAIDPQLSDMVKSIKFSNVVRQNGNSTSIVTDFEKINIELVFNDFVTITNSVTNNNNNIVLNNETKTLQLNNLATKQIYSIIPSSILTSKFTSTTNNSHAETFLTGVLFNKSNNTEFINSQNVAKLLLSPTFIGQNSNIIDTRVKSILTGNDYAIAGNIIDANNIGFTTNFYKQFNLNNLIDDFTLIVDGDLNTTNKTSFYNDTYVGSNYYSNIVNKNNNYIWYVWRDYTGPNLQITSDIYNSIKSSLFDSFSSKISYRFNNSATTWNGVTLTSNIPNFSGQINLYREHPSYVVNKKWNIIGNESSLAGLGLYNFVIYTLKIELTTDVTLYKNDSNNLKIPNIKYSNPTLTITLKDHYYINIDSNLSSQVTYSNNILTIKN